MFNKNSRFIYLSLLMVTGLMGAYTVPFVISYYIDALGFSEYDAGNLGMIEMMMIAVSSIVFSLCLRFWDERRVIVIALLVFIAAQITTVFVSFYPLLFMLRALVGFSSGILLAVVNNNIAKSECVEKCYGVTLAYSSAIFSLLLFLTPQVSEAFGSVGIFVFFPVIAVLALLKNTNIAVSADKFDALSSLKSPSVNYIGVGLFFVALTALYVVSGGTWAYSERLATNIGIDHSRLGLLLGLSTVFGIGGAGAAGFIGLRLGRWIPIVFGFLLSGLSCLLISAAKAEWLFSIGALIYGFVYMFTLTFVLSLAADLDSSGRIAVVANGYLLIPYSFGVTLYAAFGVDSLELLGYIAFFVCALSSLIVAVVTTGVAQREKKERTMAMD